MADYSQIKSKLNEIWKDPKKRKGILVSVLLGVVVFGVLLTDDGGEKEALLKQKQQTKGKKVEANFFSQAGANTIEKGQMDEIYGLMEDQIKDREQAIDKRENEIRQLEDRLSRQIEDLQFNQSALKRELDIKKKAEATPSKNATYGGSMLHTPQPVAPVQPQQPIPSKGEPQNIQQVAQQQILPPKPVVDHRRVGIRTITASSDEFIDYNGAKTDLKQPQVKSQEGAVDKGATRTINGQDDVKKADKPVYKQQESEPKSENIILPAGSIISGILTTGMDVPTGSSTRHDPLPSILRVNKDALLPNNFRADIQDCVLVTSAIGDISSSRAYLRAEALSCVTADGVAVETTLNAFSVGPDGRNGIKGRLVSKNGEAAMKSMWAGFLAGMSGLAGKTDVHIADNETGAFGAFQSASAMGTVAGGAALQGASSAMDRLAKYYIDIVEEMRPYIEINPGIEIDFIIQRGTTLKIGN
ncbi:TraB/VirB10 family protein [Photobacterium damselae]|uniref:TraB/VirB10 family protein n=1 Tax=Photobacterium damselae TaxID=38293 RepID=UPI00159FC81F|nr:TraB/VirB10 family protein [Photobacterium damselae]NVO58996.1 hypothetical protein [Photobacterium damselae subsp. damselae]